MNLVKLTALAAIGLATLTACGGTDISGTYTGDIECGTLESPTTLTLTQDEDDKEKFNGDLTMTFAMPDSNPRDPNNPVGVTGDWTVTIDATIDPKEKAQDVDVDATLASVANCSVAGEDLDDCSPVDDWIANAGLKAITEYTEFAYDGENELSIDEFDCEGDLDRPAP